MIWMTWRQFRTQAIVAAAGLAVFTVLLAITGVNLAHLYAASGLPGCQVHGDCAVQASNLHNQIQSDKIYNPVFLGGIALLFAVPALTGVFWGAPLITREIESGTFRLAWNQGATRSRWLAVKLAVIGLTAMTIAGLLSVMESWWASPLDKMRALGTDTGGPVANLRIDPVVFGARGIAPIGYAALAFVLGVTAGVLLRRTIPAMATTLAGFAFIQLAWPTWVRPHLITPARSITALTASNIQGTLSNGPNGPVTIQAGINNAGPWWILSNQTIDKAGHVFTGPAPQACLSQTAPFQACQNALAKLNLRTLITYQPASRFWTLQWYETGIFLVLAAALAGFCFWWINRRQIA